MLSVFVTTGNPWVDAMDNISVVANAITPLIILIFGFITRKFARRIEKLSKSTHILVNSEKGLLLKRYAEDSRAHAILVRFIATEDIANETKQKVAEQAEKVAAENERLYHSHQTQQALVDKLLK